MLDYDIVGAIKIKDGLFLGDEYAAQDLEFIVTNKVAHVINCAAKQVPNHWETVDVKYLSYGWLESDSQIIFDPKDDVLNSTYKVIEDALEKAESVLVHSIRGQNRSVCIIASYMMKKYRWTLYKTMEYIHSRRPDLEIKAAFFNQLLSLENKLTRQGNGAKSYNWKQLSNSNNNQESNDELLLTNTFLNSKLGSEQEEEKVDKNNSKEIKSSREGDSKTQQKSQSKSEEKQQFNLKKADEIEDFDLNSFDGDPEEEENKNSQAQQNKKEHALEKEVKDQQESEKKNNQSTNKIRKIVWTDEENGGRPLCSLEIPPYDLYHFNKKKIKPIVKQQSSFYRSILKGSNKIFSLKSIQNQQQQESKETIDTTTTTTTTNQSALNTSSTNGNAANIPLRKIANIKTSTLRSKKPEDALQEKRIIMQKISNSANQIPAQINDISNNPNLNDSNKQVASLNNIPEDNQSNINKQFRNTIPKQDQTTNLSQVETNKNSTNNNNNNNEQELLDPLLKSSSIKEKRRNITRKDLLQTANSNGNNNEQKQNNNAVGTESKSGVRQYEILDDDFAFVSSKSNNNNNNNVTGMNNLGNTIASGLSHTLTNFSSTGMNTSGVGMSVSSKNFYMNSSSNGFQMQSSLSSGQLGAPKFTIKNSFKSTQKIYQNNSFASNNINTSNSKQPQTNNFLNQLQNRTTPDIGLQIQKLSTKPQTDDKKSSKITKFPYSRPSTAPQKQNPYQRMLMGSSIKSQLPISSQSSLQPTERSAQGTTQFEHLPLPQQPSQSIPFQLHPFNPSASNNNLVRQNSQQQQRTEESNRKSLRSSSAGNTNPNQNAFSSRPPQFGFFSSHRHQLRWKC